MYKVLIHFTDLQDHSHPYYPGDIFPRDGLTVTQERLDELSTNKNRRKIVLIEKIEEFEDVGDSKDSNADKEPEDSNLDEKPDEKTDEKIEEKPKRRPRKNKEQ